MAFSTATVVTNAGRAIVTNRIIGSGTEPKFLSWGTGVGTTAKADTTLFTETTSTSNSGGNNTRVSGTSSSVTVTYTNDTYQVTGTLVADVGKTVREDRNAGLAQDDALKRILPDQTTLT